MEQTPKRKTHTSNAVKDRWKKKNYESVQATAIPKEKGILFKQLVKQNGDSISKIVEAAIDEYISKAPISEITQAKQNLADYIGRNGEG